MKALKQRIEDRTAKIAVLGLGYVGLPLLLEVHEAGFPVIGIDPAEDKLVKFRDGISYIEDISDEQLQAANSRGNVEVTSDFAALGRADAILVCVPTPLSKTREPDTSFIRKAVEDIAATLRPGQLIALESTTYPGTTEELFLPELEKTGLKVEEDFYLAFSPERVDPGNKVWQTKNTPKVVGGHGDASTELAEALYSCFIDTVVPVSGTRTAEMVKLLENTFRMVNIGLINEVAIMCNKLGVDVWEVIRAASSKPFGFMPFYPGPGLGGHCIPVDPVYLSWKLRTLNYRARFVDLADHVNSTMPNYVVFRAAAALNHQEKSIKGARILLLGMAYKENVSDLRESPALPIADQLHSLGARIEYSDPYCPSARLGHGVMESVEVTDETIGSYDLVILLTGHKDFDYPWLAENARAILDTRNAFKDCGPRKNIVKL